MNAEELLKKLDAERDAYLATLQELHDALARTIVASTPISAALHTSTPARPVFDRVASLSMSESDCKAVAPLPSLYKSSIFSGEEEEPSDDGEALYVQDPLPAVAFDDEHLRAHLKNHEWDNCAKKILGPILTSEGRLKGLFPTGIRPNEDGSHYSLYQVFDVGADGAPLPLHSNMSTTLKGQAMWRIIKDTNTDARKRQAVGRIIILREPSPTLFAAIHLTMNRLFDMDDIFVHLVQGGTTLAFMPRPFSDDPRQRRSLVFSFEYFTVIADECEPMTWQESDRKRERKADSIPISRCSSVVALSLGGEPFGKIKNSARRAKKEYGYVYSPWSPWHVLNIQCYPDWKSDTESHDSTKHYVNGPEAFLTTLLAEYKDAQKRFEELCYRVIKFVTPPADFMFNLDLRDKLLFEDSDFTYSRRYFWAFQTLGTMNQSIQAMIDAYENTLTKDVWEGHHKILWPLEEDNSQRNIYWKKRMASLKKEFEAEIHALTTIMLINNGRQKEVKSLRDNLFSGTSVLESRKSVEQSEISVQQGHNIKLLTLVNMFFLPLTFVTSVFGMTNMDPQAGFWQFGVVLATVCVPFFLLIGSMNTSRGMRFWREQVGNFFVHLFIWLCWRATAKNKTSGNDEESSNEVLRKLARSPSALEGMARRTGRPADATSEKTPDPDPSPNVKKPVFGQPLPIEEEPRPTTEHIEITRVSKTHKETPIPTQLGLSSPPSLQTQQPMIATTSYAKNNAVSEETESRLDDLALTLEAALRKKGVGIWGRLRSERREGGSVGKEYP